MGPVGHVGPISWNEASGGYVVKNHGDRVRPLSGVVGPLPNGINGLYLGVTNYLLTGGPSSK